MNQMTAEEVIEILNKRILCLSREDCNDPCDECALNMDTDETMEAYFIAIRHTLKQIAKQPNMQKIDLGSPKTVKYCPCCNEVLAAHTNYCYYCGKKLDWSGIE